MISRKKISAIALIIAGASVQACVPDQPIRPDRLPADTNWGRCLLISDGKTRIDGRCSYKMLSEGGFHIDGPDQVFDGIDYPESDSMAGQMSNDYWANILRDGDNWTGYGNADIASVHGGRSWGTLQREGDCYEGETVRICLWTE